MSKHLYILSGLGADERVFRNMEFPGYIPVFIRWIIPLDNETIENYAARLLPEITAENPILVGLSFGGIMAIEIAKQIKTEKVILLASAKTMEELPPYFRVAGDLHLVKILPASFLKRSTFISNWFFGIHTTEEKTLLKQILNDTDPSFLKWAIEKVTGWKNMLILPNLIHIHGTADRILPIRFVKCDIKVEGGGHFMTLNKSHELTELLRKILKS